MEGEIISFKKFSRLRVKSLKVNDMLQCNRDTPELRIFWVFPANPGVQITFTVKML